MTELEKVFAYLRTLAPFEFADLLPLQGHYQAEFSPAKRIIFNEGERYGKVTFILEGLVKKSYLTSEGKEFIKEFSWEGQITTPYASQLKKTPATYTMQALEDTKYLSIDYAVIEGLFEKNPNWMRLGKAFADLHFLNREEREMELLKHSATERYGIFRERFPHLLARLKKQDIAAYLGITPVALSRLTANE